MEKAACVCVTSPRTVAKNANGGSMNTTASQGTTLLLLQINLAGSEICKSMQSSTLLETSGAFGVKYSSD